MVVRPDGPRPPWRRHQGGMPVLVSSETPRRLQQRGLLLVAERIDGAIVRLVVNTDFSAKGPHFSAKRKIFPLTVKDAERALFARIQLGRSWAR